MVCSIPIFFYTIFAARGENTYFHQASRHTQTFGISSGTMLTHRTKRSRSASNSAGKRPLWVLTWSLGHSLIIKWVLPSCAPTFCFAGRNSIVVWSPSQDGWEIEQQSETAPKSRGIALFVILTRSSCSHAPAAADGPSSADAVDELARADRNSPLPNLGLLV